MCYFYYVINIVLRFFLAAYSIHIFVHLGIKLKLFFQVFMYLTGTVKA